MLMVAPLPRLMFDDELSEPAAPPTPHEEEVEQVPELVTMPSRFEKVQEKGYIDVWWLYDDGGTALYHVCSFKVVCRQCLCGSVPLYLWIRTAT